MKKFIALFFIAFAQHLWAGEINFIDNDWQKARTEAKQQGKYLFVDAYTDWCGWCKVMVKQTFSQDEVAQFMNKSFVPLKLEMEHNYGKNIAMKYGVSVFPSYLIFNPDGKLVYRMAGYMEAKAFIEKLQLALDPAKQESYPGVSDKIDLDFPDFYVKAFNENGKREFPDSVTLLNYLNNQQDLYTEVNYSVIEHFAHSLPPKYQLYFLDHQDKYASLYSRDAVDEVVGSFASQKISAAVKDSSEAELNNALAFIDAYYKSAKDKEDTKTYFKTYFYKATGNWKRLSVAVDDFIRENGYTNDQAINEWGWAIYEKAADKDIIEKAISWMKPVIDSNPKYYSMDTYAALLYKAKRWKDAETYALKAIELGKQSGDKTKSTEELLEKIRAERQ